ncbi:UDP-glucosyltransferase 2 isoform X2 [Amyelois transitella]|uniref:UDP-glucosyltransferase 2 isoform X2 n=1 Tax=Amyelois transitella TaxID=680683 RepID=UPI00298FB781|nr:UDP-glucosyltransferase 2 isoform X2 [Amyelois transitella]
MITFLIVISAVIINVNSARVLAVIPTPSISHQVAIRPLILELVNRGHQVVLITTDSLFHNGEGPVNLTEINTHDLSYQSILTFVREEYKSDMVPNIEHDVITMTKLYVNLFAKMVRVQLISEQVQKLINDKSQHFDLIILEAYLRTALVYSYIFKAPVIQISSFGPSLYNLETVGTVMHPVLHPDIFCRKSLNITLYEKFKEYYNFLIRQYITHNFEKEENEMLRKIVGSDMPPLSNLADNVGMLFLNIHSLWDLNRPVPPNVLYLGGMHIQPQKELVQELKSYLDTSTKGVIYMSFGTNVDPSMFPENSIRTFVKVFAELPYNVIWKWHTEDIPDLPKNVMIAKWLPQRDLLMHPNIKLFITQGGLQSTDETILAGVPAVGIPMIGDQWYNVDRYVDLGIGVRIDIMTMDANVFRKAIDTVINDKRYRQNIEKLRSIMYDQPQSSLERAIWWAEYVLRHGGARHLRAAGANLSWAAYYELELLAYVVSFLVFGLIVCVTAIYFVVKNVLRFSSKQKIKSN